MTVAAPERQFDDGLTDDYPPGLYDSTGVVTGVDGFAAVTDAHVDRFHEQGFLIVENAFTAHEIQVALDGLFHLLSGTVEEFNGVQYERASEGVAVEELPPEKKQDYVRKFMSFVDYDVRLNEFAHHPLLLALVERIIGEAPVLFQSMALLKPPVWVATSLGTRTTPIFSSNLTQGSWAAGLPWMRPRSKMAAWSLRRAATWKGRSSTLEGGIGRSVIPTSTTVGQ